MNWDWITDRLGVGETPADPTDLLSLADSGFTDIIDCRGELDIRYLVTGTVFEGHYLYDGTADFDPFNITHKPVEWFQKGIDFALPVLSRPRGAVYVFCHAGINRSATMAYAILRAFGLMEGEAYVVMGTHRILTSIGLLETIHWKADADAACKTLGYIT